MSEVELEKQNNEQNVDTRDAMDGGFAKVDRERLIAEETQEVTPWYKYFLRAFTSPGKMMEECYGQEPYRGASYGVVGCIIFAALYMLIYFLNPVFKASQIEQFRIVGNPEEQLEQLYSIATISGVISGVIGVFFGAFIVAIVLQIFKAIAKDKASFGNIYKICLIASMVSYAILCVDGLASCAIGVVGPLFQLSTLLGDAVQGNIILQTVSEVFSLGNIIYYIWLILGYKAITHTSMKKSILAVGIYALLGFGMTYMSLQAVARMTSMMM